MAQPLTRRLAVVLWFVAAALALAAAATRYLRSGEIEWGIVAAGLFLAAMGLSAWSRERRVESGDDPQSPR